MLGVLLIVLVVAVAAAVALGWGDRMVSVPVDRAPAGLDPDAPVSAADIPQVRFNLALRGYRMAEVDRVLGQLAVALAAKDGRIAELESDPAAAGTLGNVTAATTRSQPGTATLPAPGPDPLPPAPPGPPGPAPGPDPSPPSPGPGPDPAPLPGPLEPPGPAQPPMLSGQHSAAPDPASAPTR